MPMQSAVKLNGGPARTGGPHPGANGGDPEHVVGEVPERPLPGGARLATLLDLTPAAVIEIDRDGRVLSWNRAATEIFQWTPAEVILRRCPLLTADRRSDFDDILRRLREGRRVPPVETTRTRKDGRLVEVGLSAAPLRDEAGGLIGGMLILTDLSERAELRGHVLELALERLSPREREVVELLGRARSYKEIARELGCSEGSVGTLAHRAYTKLRVASRTELMSLLFRRSVWTVG